MALFRNTYSETKFTIINKMHLLGNHTLQWENSNHVGFGLLGEQGAKCCSYPVLPRSGNDLGIGDAYPVLHSVSIIDVFFSSYHQGSTITKYPTCLFKAMSQRGVDSACGSSATEKNVQSWVWKHFTLKRQTSAKDKFPLAKYSTGHNKSHIPSSCYDRSTKIWLLVSFSSDFVAFFKYD